jgi:hypothetical protein
MVWTVTELEPLRNFTWATGQPGLSFEAVHRIEDAGDHVRTTLEFIARAQLAWWGADRGISDPLISRRGEHWPEAGSRERVTTRRGPASSG